MGLEHAGLGNLAIDLNQLLDRTLLRKHLFLCSFHLQISHHLDTLIELIVFLRLPWYDIGVLWSQLVQIGERLLSPPFLVLFLKHAQVGGL